MIKNPVGFVKKINAKNKTKQNKTKQNKTKQTNKQTKAKTEQNKTKNKINNKTKQNKKTNFKKNHDPPDVNGSSLKTFFHRGKLIATRQRIVSLAKKYMFLRQLLSVSSSVWKLPPNVFKKW